MYLSRLKEKTVLVTGATGLIGKNLIRTLLEANSGAADKIRVIASVRNLERAQEIFTNYLCDELEFLVGDICNISPQNLKVDYIVHGASQTSSKAFVNEPVETIMTALNGTKNLLEFARLNTVKGFVYLSSMEVYGSPTTDEKINEHNSTDINTMSVRSCYPESKRMCETLCSSYEYEYGVPIKVLRLTQTFGPGVHYNDGRVFAEFARCAIEGRDIVLNTKGETKRNYLYTDDAVAAILTVLLDGKRGEAYNAANEDTYCSIYEMACLVAEKCSDNYIRVIVDEKDDTSRYGYAPTLQMNLDTAKLRNLGWKQSVGLIDMYKRMIRDMTKI
ncbi:NAD-dependent epimerase/dehydratase family protein [Anaerosporobacter sp.]|uniref:NAD-dependent epimerase/dehydratase family protein n=1 Tax=Anaerosporobacter sp. TaxID=1872529 RepID=UPI00286F4868|nr:NAD(P)-dependent oxidoreductase [Anaerosporobacter sp.]